jgi:hypothetical protein
MDTSSALAFGDVSDTGFLDPNIDRGLTFDS